MKLCVPVRVRDCRALLRQNLDSRFALGMERHVGWVIACFFSMVYHSGRETGLWYNLISHKAMGILLADKGKTNVYYVVFKGLTDPVSLFLVFAGSFLVFWVLWPGDGAPLMVCIYLALVCAVLSAMVTYFLSAFTRVGRQANRQLQKTLWNLLTNLPGV